MTSGTVVKDARVSGTADSRYGGSYSDPYAGSYQSKVWSGGDQVRVPTKPGVSRTRVIYDDHSYSMSYLKIVDSKARRARQLVTPSDPTWYTWTDSTYQWAMGNSIPLTGEFGPNDVIDTVGKLREKIAGSDFNAGVFLAEAGDSLDMIFRAANKVDTSLRRLRRGDLLGAHKALVGDRAPSRKLNTRKDVASNWLELQYGWLPLLGDAKAGAEALAAALSRKVVPVRVSKTKRAHFDAAAYSDGNWTADVSCSTRYAILAKVRQVDSIQLSGVLDPYAVAWERTPWSFVVDWFLPIGDYLYARGLPQAIAATYVITQFRRLRHQGLSRPVVSSDPYRASFSSAGYSYESIDLSRSVSSSLDVPLPKAVGLGEAFSWRRAANAVALVTSNFTRYK